MPEEESLYSCVRNTQGLKENAQRKRQKTFAKAEEGIKRLVREGKEITFEAVAEVAGVSRAWLYKQPELRERIEYLRNQQSPKRRRIPANQRASEASNAAKAKTLLQEVKKLRIENQGLRQHIEGILGRSIYADEQVQKYKREAEALRLENEKLKRELTGYHSQSAKQERLFSAPMQTQINMPAKLSRDTQAIPSVSQSTLELQISEYVHTKLTALGISLNPTLLKTLKAASEETILNAINALNEAKHSEVIERPGGWLKRAIEEKWQPNQSLEQKHELELFNEWFTLAKAKNLVIASTKSDERLMVLTAEEEWITFAAAVLKYPL